MNAVDAAPRLRAKLSDAARGSAIVIDYYASARCGLVVGDITADLTHSPPADTHVLVADVEGVPVLAEPRLVPLLEQSGIFLNVRRLPFGERLAVYLDPPDRWLEFLQRPGVVRRRLPRFGRL